LYSIDSLESVLQTASTIEEFTSNVTVCIFFFFNLINRRKVYQTFFKLSTFDKIIGNMYLIYRQSLLIVIAQMSFHMIFLGSVGIVSIINGGFKFYTDLLRCISFGSNFLIVLVVDLEIINLVFALKQRFCAINSRFSEYISETNFEFPIRKRCANRSPLFVVHSVPKLIQVKPFVEVPLLKLKNLTDLHDFLCDIAELVNSTYSVHMLFNVMLKFIAIIFNVYFRLLRVLNYDRGRYEDHVYEGIMVAILCWNVMQLTALVWTCHSACEEVSSSPSRKESILKGSDDGVMHFEESCFRALSIVQCSFFKNNVLETGFASVFR
jgi:hypothetical protein